MQLDSSNLHSIAAEHGLSETELNSEKDKIDGYLEKVHARKQGFYEIVDDEETLAKVQSFADGARDKYDHFVVLGIGGSSLGMICLQQSLTHLYKVPKIHVVDNIDPIMIKELEDVIDPAKTLFIPITKSGGTPETLSLYFYFRKVCDDLGLDAAEHFAFVTDPEKGLLVEIAREDNIPTFDVPSNVGGRFSVLTPVGLLPAALIGLDIKELLNGARHQRDAFLSSNFQENLAFQLATIQYQLNAKHKYLTVMMPYSQKLIRLSDWYRQLLAESIGKKQDNDGKVVHTGLTPVNALGATDQHSQAQLYNEGPNDKLFIFIDVEDFGADLEIPNLKPEAPQTNYLKNVSFKKLIHTEKQGTEQALSQNDRPSISIKLPEVNEYSLGELFMFFEASIAFLGEMYNINAFDQPGVELSKNLTKELLLKD
jgi:glucose-6-phosphate isomerase